jgi:hypothetical protein
VVEHTAPGEHHLAAGISMMLHKPPRQNPPLI